MPRPSIAAQLPARDFRSPDLSLVIPVLDEVENLEALHAGLKETLDRLNLEAEVILVDDGSRDGSFEVLRQIAARDSRCRVIRTSSSFAADLPMDDSSSTCWHWRIVSSTGSISRRLRSAAMIENISHTSDRLSKYSRRSPRSNVVRISTTASFASQFIVPRLQLFREKFPDIDLEFITTIRLVDLSREEFDIAVRYGGGQWEGVISTPISEAVLLPVCTPQVLERGGGSLAGLLTSARRIQCSAYNEWRDWAEIEKFDLAKVPPTMVIEEFQVALTAALASQGLALLPEILVRDRIKRGELVLFSPARVKTGSPTASSVAVPVGRGCRASATRCVPEGT